ncbi:MAG: DNA-directed RNA polymerase subunit L [Candidatus Diapherotrites archaeon]|uniref:DNA-directed RNA polymerase subunit Rpo11 n=1 Tax=Candidatus Iainarchaeum sp. TaxID=3101447 RepID=A0A938YSU8_9ARCH|nr:DNA-directed RNA polymerase subunit L [Candidatus Diapherotrites archaeon]
MDIEVLTSKKDELEFVLKGERHTFPNLLREALLEESGVEFAAYRLEHPFDSECRFVVRTKGKTPKKALSDALKKVDSNLSEFKKAFKAAK